MAHGTGTVPHGGMGAEAAAADRTLAGRLREETREQHTRAEKHPFQGRLVSGRASREEYVRWLGQLWHVYDAMDRALRGGRAASPVLGAMVEEYHYHAARAAEDLAEFGVAAAPEALPATRAFVSAIEGAAGGTDLLGAWYVLEGSTNGGRFIAKAVAKALGLSDGRGTRLLDPHGEAQRERWARWREALMAQTLGTEAEDRVVAAAKGAFDAVYAMLEEIDAARAAMA